MSASAADALHEGAELPLEAVEGGIKEFPAWNNDDIQTCGRFLVLEYLPHPALGAVSHDGAADLSRRRNPEPGHRLAGGPGEDRHKPPARAGAGLISLLKIRPPANMLRAVESSRAPLGWRPGLWGLCQSYRSSETVRRFRPFARRRFNTCCPSLVAIRTRNPCVFLRRRVFG